MTALSKIENHNYNLSDSDILELLNIDATSPEFYRLIAVSNAITRQKSNNKGYVFTQIGINAQPCSIDCKFCSLASSHYSLSEKWEKSIDDVELELKGLMQYHFDDFFLMATADYPVGKFLEMAKALKPLLRPDQKFVANVGDFDTQTAQDLVEAGITGIYHINRLREGIDTKAQPQQREATIEAARKAGLEIYYCIEPIGPEHSYEEILTEIKRARDLNISVMAAMRRTPVKGTPLADKGMLSTLEMTKIAAVTNIVVNPSRSMNVHEPSQMTLLAGINQLYAELGANPRDTDCHTENNRGFTPEKAWEMLCEAGYER
ncbi:biotin synthase BioB [Saccharicrinis aurantiacus]|uniref:radical SAM protein n=1 Tax=Saccharicrinis aurantiacus TaxID=1849719 RepID=UPI00094F4F5F|nr:radical SAM protein [Saccharicrinis aurantiacus]